MYVLLFFILLDGKLSTYYLESYADKESCTLEQVRITKEMVKVYPDDMSYWLSCKLVEKKKRVV